LTERTTNIFVKSIQDFFQREEVRFTVFAFLILLTRIPFLYDGYGIDSDAWSLAITAKNISETHQYEVSRFPGYPFQEIVSALSYTGNYFSLNFLTALISTIGILYFALFLRTLHFRQPLLGAAALAFVPAVYIESTTALDYMWALSFVLISMYYISRHRPIVAGIFLGIAIGCRITSGAMIIPLAIMSIWGFRTPANVARILKFVLASLIVGTLLYLPVYLKYGWTFFTYYDTPYPSIPAVLYKLFIGLWGVIGTIAFVVAIALLLFPDSHVARRYLFPRSVNEKYIVAWLIAIDLYIIAYLRLPMESGYLIPIVPFVILIFGKYLYNRAFTFFAVSLIFSSLACSVSPMERSDAPTSSAAAINFSIGSEKLELDFLQGPVVAYQSRRQNGLDFTNRLGASFDTLRSNSLLVCGKWYNQIYLTDSTPNSLLRKRDYVSQDSLLYYVGKNYRIYYLPRQDFYNQVMHGYDINLFGAEPYGKTEGRNEMTVTSPVSRRTLKEQL
jgi:hypothetical protein